jgi:adenine-specific DNA-methyltransferase
MDKLNMQTTNQVDENIKKIAELFPNCLTERLDENGKPEAAIDFDQLRQELSKDIVEGSEERYQFTWPDKRNAIRLANAPTTDTLRPCREESVDFDNTQNLYIEGDNLEVLKLLRENYLGKVKMIYIDPPYNTGNDFVYNDDFAQTAGDYVHNSGQEDEEGNRLVANTESNGRFHTDWLNMIYPRLKVAKDLLSADGAIFVSIDDNEICNLLKILNEIYGEHNYVADISWQKTYSPKNNNTGVSAEVEHIVVYSKYPNWTPNRLNRTKQMDSLYSNPDNDRCDWTSADAFAPGAVTHQGMVYAVQNPFNGELIYPTKGRCWCREQRIVFESISKWAKYKLVDLHDEGMRAEICGISREDVRKEVAGIILDEPLEEARKHASELYAKGPWPLFYFTKGGQGRVRRKAYLDDMDGKIVTNLWQYDEVGHNDEAKKELKSLFSGNAPFDTPKPTRLVKRILDIATKNDSLVLDFFSGSATTAQATMEKNAEDFGQRRFILVQLNEKCNVANYSNLCEIGKERIRRAGKKIVEELEKKKVEEGLFAGSSTGSEARPLDIGFRVLKLDSSNMQDVYYSPEQFNENLLFEDNIKHDRTDEDLLFQAMIELGIELSAKIEKREIAGKTVWSVADHYLMACFDKDVNETTITEIARQKPYYFVMRDSSLATDNVADNFEQIWEEYSKETIRRII